VIALKVYLCPSKVAWHLPEGKCQTLMLLSHDPDTRVSLSRGLNAMELTGRLPCQMSSYIITVNRLRPIGVDRALAVARARYTCNSTTQNREKRKERLRMVKGLFALAVGKTPKLYGAIL
jgi:hypothetical protein